MELAQIRERAAPSGVDLTFASGAQIDGKGSAAIRANLAKFGKYLGRRKPQQ